jgi:hypothetical protein
VDELRHGRAERDAVQRAEVDERAKEDGQLVAGVGRLGADAELLFEPAAFEQAEDGLRVPDVDREQQRRGPG